MTSTTQTLAELLQQGDDARELLAYRRIDAERDVFAVVYYGDGGAVRVATVDLDAAVALQRPVRIAGLGRATRDTVDQALNTRQREELERAATAPAPRFTVVGAATGRAFAVDVDVAAAARELQPYRPAAAHADLVAELAALDVNAEVRTDEHAAGIVITRIR